MLNDSKGSSRFQTQPLHFFLLRLPPFLNFFPYPSFFAKSSSPLVDSQSNRSVEPSLPRRSKQGRLRSTNLVKQALQKKTSISLSFFLPTPCPNLGHVSPIYVVNLISPKSVCHSFIRIVSFPGYCDMMMELSMRYLVRLLMYAYGDDEDPLDETVRILDEIVTE